MNLFKDFTKFEKIWVSLFTILILGTTIWFSYLYTDYSSVLNIALNWVISPLSALTGIFCVVLAAKGKISTFTWGVVNTLSYGGLAFYSGVYGDAIINLFYFLPFQFIGLIVWKKKMNGETVKSDALKHPILTILLAGLSWFGFSKLLNGTDGFLSQTFNQNSIFYDALPKGVGSFIDASTEVMQFFGQLLMTAAKWEQWVAWIITNIVSIFMWAVIALSDKTSLPYAVPTLIMFLGYLINSFYGMREWKKRYN